MQREREKRRGEEHAMSTYKNIQLKNKCARFHGK